MQSAEIIRKLWNLGHFHNPAHLTGVTEINLPKLKLTDPVVRTAIQSYQEFMANDFDALSLQEHNRIGIADGQIGPATEKLFEVERCGYPDYHEAGAAMAMGVGSWPANCRPGEWPNTHTFSVQVDKTNMPSFLGAKNDPNSLFEQCWVRVRQAYADIGIVFIREDNNPKANTLVTWQRGSGWIGLAIVPSRPGCSTRIWAKFDISYRPGDLFNQWCRLLAHEWCHNMGLSHTRGGIMNPSIVNGPFTATAWRGDPSFPALAKFFGGQPVKLDDSPIPGPTPDNGGSPVGTYFTGSVRVVMDGKPSADEYILVPKPKV
jgi:hypothetical protein